MFAMSRPLFPCLSMAAALAIATALTGCGRSELPSKASSGDGAAAPATNGESVRRESVELLNVSYDPTRELYRELNQAFAEHWEEQAGQTVSVRQSHGGSGKQARAVIDGLDADVVTLGVALDIDAISEKSGLLPADWRTRLPHDSAPYTSTIVFLVRKGNPKGIADWDDLVKEDVAVITPNPKTSAAGRLNYLAAWGFRLRQVLGGDLERLHEAGSEQQVAKGKTEARAFVQQLYRHVPVLDTGARSSTNTFVQREIGDVLLAWENEALLAVRQMPGKLDIVIPSVSILAAPSVSVVDQVVDRHGTREVAEAYLEFLYSPVGQDLAAKHYYRPVLPDVAAKYASVFPEVDLFRIEAVFGGWQEAHRVHFADGGMFDAIYMP